MAKTNKKAIRILTGSVSIASIIGLTFLGYIYYFFLTKPFQLSETTYIYIDRDDNIDSVYTKIIEAGNPKQMHGFEVLAKRGDYSSHIKTGRYALKPSDNMRYLYTRLSLG